MRSYIIHMSGDQKRQANAKALLSCLPNARIADAVVGKDVLATGQAKIAPGTLYEPRYPFALSAGEVGCFLSHRACWKRIVKDDLDYALIAEDDLALDPEIWPSVLVLIERNASPETLIRIPAKHRETARAELDSQDNARLFQPKVIGLQTVFQVVGRQAAQRLIAASKVIDRPVDTFMQMHWATGQNVLTIHPNGIRELTDDLGGSSIQSRPTSGKVKREIQRALYRWRVKTRPQPTLDQEATRQID